MADINPRSRSKNWTRRQKLVRLLKETIDEMDDFGLSRIEQVVSVEVGRVQYGKRKRNHLWEEIKYRLSRFSVHI